MKNGEPFAGAHARTCEDLFRARFGKYPRECQRKLHHSRIDTGTRE